MGRTYWPKSRSRVSNAKLNLVPVYGCRDEQDEGNG